MSILGAQTYYFVDCFYSVFFTRDDLSRKLGRRISIVQQMDSERLFKILGKASTSTERCLMIEGEATKEKHNKMDTGDIG